MSQGKYIYKINSSGTVLSTVLFTGTKLGVGSQTEMEGLQIMSSLLFFTVKDYSVSGNIHYIYNINPTVFD